MTRSRWNNKLSSVIWLITILTIYGYTCTIILNGRLQLKMRKMDWKKKTWLQSIFCSSALGQWITVTSSKLQMIIMIIPLSPIWPSMKNLVYIPKVFFAFLRIILFKTRFVAVQKPFVNLYGLINLIWICCIFLRREFLFSLHTVG